jgi:CBS domain containing-hemolysin-like protein
MDLLLVLGCWAISFLFAGIEAGVLAVDPVRLRSQVKRKQRSAQRLYRLLQSPERLLVTVLLVTNMADILALLLLTLRLFDDFGLMGFVISLLVNLPIYVFVLGVLPKSLFRRFPFRALAPLAGLLEIISTILWPVLEVGKRLGGLFLPRKMERARLFAAREELKQIAVQSEKEGSLTATERFMIHNVVDFTTVQVRQVMLPLARTVTIKPQTAVADVLRLSARTNADRIPVIAGDAQAVGLVNVLDILCDRTGPRPLNDYMRRIITAREDEPAYRVIRRLRAAGRGLAVVENSKHKLTGIVTIEELIRRLVSPTPGLPARA